MDAKYLAEIKARCEAGRPTARIDVKALLAEVERLQKIVKLQKASCSLVKTVEAGNTIAENATLKKALEAAKEDIHALNTLCLTEGGCCSCCGNQNDALMDAGCEFCKKSGVSCWVQDKENSERCAAFEWRGVQQAQQTHETQEAEK